MRNPKETNKVMGNKFSGELGKHSTAREVIARYIGDAKPDEYLNGKVRKKAVVVPNPSGL